MLKVYNTLTRKKEVFKPLHGKKVGMWVCGPTVYDYCHMGHAKAYIQYDVIIRYLRYLGYDVFHVRNITDVGHLTDDADMGEDKIVKRARERKVHPMELVDYFIRAYWKDMDSLGIERPNLSPRATGHIIEIIEMVKGLLEKGYAYEKNGSVYFSVAKFKDYGKLSRVKEKELKHGSREEGKTHPDKKDPRDFALWKRAEKGHIMRWKSPWGEGYPGWHIEDSAIAHKYLGEQYDLHGGAIELRFPHHEAEIAQCEAFTGKKPVVKYWIHVGLLTVDNEKMSKSTGNFMIVSEALKKYEPNTIRLLMISSHYRKPLDFNEGALKDAEKSYARIDNFLKRLDHAISTSGNKKKKSGADILKKCKEYKKKFLENMDNDFDTPSALSELFNLINYTNKCVDQNTGNRKVYTEVRKMVGEMLSIFNITESKSKTKESGLVDILVRIRDIARKNKDYEVSDRIRSELKALGIVIEDTEKGTVVK